ncbi:MAG: prolipoprotein diacylglyceryl transferase [Clostridia bacterium]|nr:prolipoprotein diacylglyceryl transferase [Clostridia bacterium]
MYNTLTFPYLDLEFQVSKYLFFIGSYGVTWTLVFFVLALLVGVGVFLLMAKKHKLSKGAIGIAALSLLIGVVGARFAGVLISNAESLHYAGYRYYNSFGKIIDFGDGRSPLYCGIVFALLGGFILCKARKNKDVHFGSICDTGVFALTAGLFVYRISHLFTQSYFGDPAKTKLAMGGNIIDESMQLIRESAINQGANPFELKYIVGLPVHPVFLYEMMACVLIFALLFSVYKKAYFRGETLIAFLALYGGCRAVFEGMRLDNQVYGQLLPYQLAGLFCCVLGIIAWIVLRWQAVEGNLGAASLYSEKVHDDGFGNGTVKVRQRVYTSNDEPETKGGDGFGDLPAKETPKTYTKDDSEQ